MKPVVVVGASLAGTGAVESMRAAGYDGPVTLIDAATVLPHDRPPLTKQVLAGEWELDRAERAVAGRLDDLDVRVMLRARAVSMQAAVPRVTLDDGASMDASAVVLATGSTPRTLGAELPPGTHVLRNGDDCLALRVALEATPERVVVVGAGFIGAEVASTCRLRGIEVSMIEAAEVPLAHVVPDGIGRFLAGLHRDNGVDVRLSSPIERITLDAHGHTAGVVLDGGELIEAPVVVVGIGAAPQVSWLADSGLELVPPQQGGGIRCDETLLAAPGVVAAGDVAAWPNPVYHGEVMRVEHWENAIDQGEHAGTRALGELDAEKWGPPQAFASVPWFWSDQYSAKIQMVGRARPGDEAVVVEGGIDEGRFVVLFRRGDLCTAALGLNRPRHVMQVRMAMAGSLEWDRVAALFR